MKYLYWMVVIFGITLISASPIVPRVDDPETQYDEGEAPINLAYPVSLTTVTSADIATEVSHPMTGFPRHQVVGEHGSTMYVMKAKVITHTPRSRLNFLCALLC